MFCINVKNELHLELYKNLYAVKEHKHELYGSF
jgi:hypothetical protein